MKIPDIFWSRIEILAIFFLLLQACSVDQLGNELSQNFDSPVVTEIQENNSNNSTKRETDKDVNVSKEKIESTEIKYSLARQNKSSAVDKSQVKLPNIVKQIQPRKEIVTFTPEPYRIIIKISGANPSAPAEEVTKVLRKAGIQFEVEKIERFNTRFNRKALPTKR